MCHTRRYLNVIDRSRWEKYLLFLGKYWLNFLDITALALGAQDSPLWWLFWVFTIFSFTKYYSCPDGNVQYNCSKKVLSGPLLGRKYRDLHFLSENTTKWITPLPSTSIPWFLSQVFLDNIEMFLKQIDSINHINLFLTELK